MQVSVLLTGRARRLVGLWLGRLPTPCPHFAHTFASAGFVQGDRNRLQVVIEQVRVDVERHRRRGMAEHLLDGLDVRTRRHRETGGGVAKVVRRGVRHAGFGDRFDKPPACRVRSLQVPAIVAGER